MARLCFVDTETTSLDDLRGEVWEIAAIVREPGEADAEYLWEIRPDLHTADPMSLKVGRYYERRSLSIHAKDEAAIKLSPDLIEEQGPRPSPEYTSAADVARRLAWLLDSAHVVGAVPDFDYRFLRKFLRRHNECWTAHYHLIDVEALAVGWLHRRHGEDFQLAQSVGAVENLSLPWKSTALYEAVGVNPKQFEAHTALGDARLVRAVYDAITGGA